MARQAGLRLEGEALAEYFEIYRRFVIPLLTRLRMSERLEDELGIANRDAR